MNICKWCHIEDSLQTVTFCDKCWEDNFQF